MSLFPFLLPGSCFLVGMLILVQGQTQLRRGLHAGTMEGLGPPRGHGESGYKRERQDTGNYCWKQQILSLILPPSISPVHPISRSQQADKECGLQNPGITEYRRVHLELGDHSLITCTDRVHSFSTPRALLHLLKAGQESQCAHVSCFNVSPRK